MEEFKRIGMVFWAVVGGVALALVMTIVTGRQEARIEAEQAREIPAVPALPGAPAEPQQPVAPSQPTGVPAPAIPNQ